MQQRPDREGIAPGSNPLGLSGVEFIELTTPRPQALGHALERFGFRPVARHRSREVLLYRRGEMNLVIDSHSGAAGDADEVPRISAIAFRVQDAARAWRGACEAGAWPVPSAVQPMELWIPGVHGVGESRIYFVDRWREFSIYDIDFVAIPSVPQRVAGVSPMRWFGLVQYVGSDRSLDWAAFYGALFGFEALPEEERFGILPRGTILRAPFDGFYLQLVESPPDDPSQSVERLQRIAFAVPDVARAEADLRERGVAFVELDASIDRRRGALTRSGPDIPAFELVADPAQVSP